MKTLLIGKMDDMERLLKWLSCAEEIFELELVISEDRAGSDRFECEIKPVSQMEELLPCYDIVFLCSDMERNRKYQRILCLRQFPPEKIKMEIEITAFLPPRFKMDYYAERLRAKNQSIYGGPIPKKREK